MDKDKFLEEARKRAKLAKEAWEYNYERMDEDIEFLDGHQWDEDVIVSRKADGRPYLTFNRLPAMVDQIVGDQRQSRAAISVFPAQGDIQNADQKSPNITGTKDYSLAEIYEGIIRNIEYSSSADIAYDTAFEHCAGWGLGYFRILTDYADEKSFDQDFQIKRVRNYKSILLDPDFDEPDGSDMQWGFVFSKIHKDEFEKRWPDKTASNVDTDADQYELWLDGDYVMIAEYYYLKDHTYTLHQMSDGSVYDDEKVAKVLDELAAQGITVSKTRKVKGKKCMWAKISGADILEEEKDTVFSWIPIIPVMGKELVVRGTPYYRGAIRHGKDASRMYNYSRTADIERTALIPKVPYIIADKQIAGYEKEWESASTTNRAFLRYKYVSGLQKPGREPPVSTNPGEVNQSMQAADDIKTTVGIFDASLGDSGPATSGKQELIQQRESDVGHYAFSDNMTRSIRHAGRILINAIPKLYDTQRLLRLRFPDDSEDFVEINKTVFDEQSGQEITINDLSVGKFDLVIKAGPSYNTQRMEALNSMKQVLDSAPQLWNVIGDLLAKNMEWPGADEFAKRLKKMVPPDILDDKDQEQPPPPPPPTEQEQMAAQIEQGKIQAEIAKAEATMATAKATEAKAMADIELAKSKEIGAQADILEVTERIQGLEENLKDQVAGLIAQTIQELQQPEN